MANKKYTDLAAGGALNGTETAAVSKGGVSVKYLLSAIKTWVLSATTLAGYGITDAAPSSHVGAGGAAHANAVPAGAAGFLTGADKTKLDDIIAGIAGASTWAAIPAASTVAKGKLWFVNDITSAGKFFKSDGATRWYPVGGTENIYTLAAPVTGLWSTETIAGQVLIPANLWQIGDTLRIWNSWGKTGTTNALSIAFRLGTAGTVADTVIGVAGTALSAANRSCGLIHDFILRSATTVQREGTNPAGTSSAGSYGSATAGTPAAAITVTSAAANALYLSVTGLSNGSTDTMSLESMQVQIISKT